MSKSAKAKLIFLIATFTDNPHDWIDVFSSPLPRISGYPKRDKTIKKAISELLSQGKLEYKKDKDLILIRPSRKAYQELSLSFPFYRTFLEKWDGKYRIITYDIPELNRKQRDALRRILKIYKLGMWSSSVWVSPYSVESLQASLRARKLDNLVHILKAQFFDHGNIEFAEKIWKLSQLNTEYKNLYKNIHNIVAKPRGRRRMVDIFRNSFIHYQQLLSKDPGLPDGLLPNHWYGMKVRKELKKLQKLL